MNERERRRREEENNLQAAAKSIKINEMQSRFTCVHIKLMFRYFAALEVVFRIGNMFACHRQMK